MITHEVLAVLDGVRQMYNSNEFDFSKRHSMPLLIIEDSRSSRVSGPVVLERLFKTLLNCYKYLGLPKVDYRLKHLQRLSDQLVATSVVWELFGAQKRVELVMEIGHIM